MPWKPPVVGFEQPWKKVFVVDAASGIGFSSLLKAVPAQLTRHREVVLDAAARLGGSRCMTCGGMVQT